MGECEDLFEEGGVVYVDEFGGTDGVGYGEFIGVEVGGDDACASGGGSGDASESDGAASDDEYGVVFGGLCAFDGVESYGEGFDEGCFGEGESVGGDEFFPGLGDAFGEGTFALYAEGGVVFAGVVSVIFAGGAFAAAGVGVDGDGVAYGEGGGDFGAEFFDDGSDFVSGYAGV